VRAFTHTHVRFLSVHPAAIANRGDHLPLGKGRVNVSEFYAANRPGRLGFMKFANECGYLIGKQFRYSRIRTARPRVFAADELCGNRNKIGASLFDRIAQIVQSGQN